MAITLERHAGETTPVPAAGVRNAPGEPVVIPARLLTAVAAELAGKTRRREINWVREKMDREHYYFAPGMSKIAVRFHPSRAEADAVELAVLTHSGEVIGSVYANEEAGASYERLSELLFEIQRAENRDGISTITDELLQLLPEVERQKWATR